MKKILDSVQVFVMHKQLFLNVSLIVSGIALMSCEEDLPGVGDIEDLTPPSAGFSFMINESDYKEIIFTNTSNSASDFLWDFGDGNTSSEKEPRHTYANDGVYEVSLVASDKLGQDSSVTQRIEIIEPE